MGFYCISYRDTRYSWTTCFNLVQYALQTLLEGLSSNIPCVWYKCTVKTLTFLCFSLGVSCFVFYFSLLFFWFSLWFYLGGFSIAIYFFLDFLFSKQLLLLAIDQLRNFSSGIDWSSDRLLFNISFWGLPPSLRIFTKH